MDNGSGSGKLWKKAADLHIALGEPEAFVGEEDKLQPLRPHHFTDRPKTVPTGSRNLGLVGDVYKRQEHPQPLTVKQRLERIIYLGDEREVAGKYVEGRKLF